MRLLPALPWLLVAIPPASADTDLCEVTVRNDTSSTITAIRLSSPGATDYAEEVLLADVDPIRALAPGDAEVVLVQPGVWDLRFDSAGDVALFALLGADACARGTLTLTD